MADLMKSIIWARRITLLALCAVGVIVLALLDITGGREENLELEVWALRIGLLLIVVAQLAALKTLGRMRERAEQP